MAAGTLAALTEGEAEAAPSRLKGGPMYGWVWVGALGALLALSLVFNLILLIRG
jgi:hypothetical protein